MENLAELRSYVWDLVKAKGKTPSGVAVMAGVARGNMLRWVKGKPEGLGTPGVAKVLAVLGVLGGRLDPHRLHYFHVGADRDPLLRVLTPEGGIAAFSMLFLAPETNSPRDFMTLGVVTPLLLRFCDLRIVVFPENLVGKPLQDELLQNGCRWAETASPDSYFKNPTLRIPREDFDSIKREEMDREGIDRILSPLSSSHSEGLSWESVLEKFKEAGLTPEDAIKLLKKRK